MISMLRGQCASVSSESIVIDVQGVGYEVRMPTRLFPSFRIGSEMLVFTHHHIREDAQTLFGFTNEVDRSLFRQLIDVSGVGPKTAMSVLSTHTSDDIIRAIQREDIAALKSPGVGPKIVKRLISELKSTLGASQTLTTSTSGSTSVILDVLSALQQLGYSEQESRDMLMGRDLEELSVEQAIKLILQKKPR